MCETPIRCLNPVLWNHLEEVSKWNHVWRLAISTKPEPINSLKDKQKPRQTCSTLTQPLAPKIYFSINFRLFVTCWLTVWFSTPPFPDRLSYTDQTIIHGEFQPSQNDQSVQKKKKYYKCIFISWKSHTVIISSWIWNYF